MKKKIANIIFNLPLLILSITFLAVEQYLLAILLLVFACITFYYISSSNELNINKRILNTVVIYLIILLVVTIGNFIINLIKDKQEQKEFEEDINKCYKLLNEDYNYEEFEQLIEKHNYDFEVQAYDILEKIIDERLEQTKAGTNNNEFINMLNGVSIDDYDIEQKFEELKEFNIIVEIDECVSDNDYITAYKKITLLLSDTRNEEVKKIVKSKQDNIKDLLIEQIINTAQDYINKKDYDSAEVLLSDYLRLNNEKIRALYDDISTKTSEAVQREKERFDYEVYCYFNLIVWNEKIQSDDEAFSKCASKFGITKEEAKECYETVNSKGGWWYQDEYPDIFEKYASQYN